MKQRLQFCIQIRHVFHFFIRFKLHVLAEFCDNHKKYGVNLQAIFLGFDVFLVLYLICEKSARGYSDLRCVVRNGGHIYICNWCVPGPWDGGCWYPWNQNIEFTSILRQDSVFKTRLQDLEKNSSLNSNDMVSVLKTTTILFIPSRRMPLSFATFTCSSQGGKIICMSRTSRMWLVNRFSFGNTWVSSWFQLLSIKRLNA